MKKNNILIISFLLTILFSNDTVQVNYIDDDIFDQGIYIDLESHNKTGYLFSKHHPYLMDDIEYFNFKIDGSMMYPLINSIPKQSFLNNLDSTNFSQLSIIQDHSNKYYDTGAILKTYLGAGLSSITQIESKSIYGDNYNTKFITSFYKNYNDLELDIGYMYNQDDILTYLESSNDNFNRGIESFSSKLYFKYDGINNMTISNQFNSQISNYNRYIFENIIDHLSDVHWNDFLINYRFGISKIELKSKYKYISSDITLPDEFSSYMNHSYSQISLSYNFMHNPHFIFGVDYHNSSKDSKPKIYYFLNSVVDIENFSIGIHINNDIFLDAIQDYELIGIRRVISKTRNISFGYKNNNFMQNLVIGKNSSIGDIAPTPLDDYYYLYDAGINYNWVDLNLNYGNYNSNELYIKEYISFNVIISPTLNDKRYKPYCSLKFSDLVINPNYSISNEQLGLISNVNSSIESIRILDGEFGFLFQNFKIAFIKENMLESYLYYSGNIESGNKYFPNTSKYLINITWIFED